MNNTIKQGFYRLALLIRRDLHTQWRSALLSLAAAAAFVIAVALIAAFQGNAARVHEILFPLLFFPGGYILASRAFSDMHKKDSIQHFLLLPAGALEKTAARLLFTGPGYVLLASFGYTVASLLAWGLTSLLFKTAVLPFNPFTEMAGALYIQYLVTHSIFFLGAAWFRKNHLLKTVLALIGFAFLVMLFSAASFRIVFWDFFSGFFTPDKGLNTYFDAHNISLFPGLGFRLMRYLEIAVKGFYFFVIPPFCWIVAWLRIKEVEVNHGV
jgi:hypothetical protein